MCKKYIKTTLLFLCSLLLLTGCGNITTTSTTDQKAVSSQSDTQSSAKADNDTTDLKSNTAQPQKNDSDQTKDSNQTEKSSADQKSSSAQTQKNSPAKKSNTTQSKKNSLSKKSASSHVTNNSSTTKTSSKLLVHFIDVGQGDSILITQGKHAMLIDAGNNDKGTTVQLYLKKQGLTSLDYVIGTHPDADHIGGLDVVIYKFDCKKILLPDWHIPSFQNTLYPKIIQPPILLPVKNSHWEKLSLPLQDRFKNTIPQTIIRFPFV